MPTAFIPFNLHVTARESHQHAFRTDIERLTSNRRAPLSTVQSTDRMAYLRGAIAKGDHTADEASLARFLNKGMAENGIHLDITVSLEH